MASFTGLGVGICCSWVALVLLHVPSNLLVGFLTWQKSKRAKAAMLLEVRNPELT